jgi:predicted cupin superfamily sugar epimerase
MLRHMARGYAPEPGNGSGTRPASSRPAGRYPRAVDDDGSEAVIAGLGMTAHPEGGWYVETWRAPAAAGERPAASTILYLLAAGERSHWHRVDAAEVWQWSAGEALELRIWPEGASAVTTIRLGGDVRSGDTPQAVVPAGAWQAARPLGAWALVGCIVAPAFRFEGFELAPAGWTPPVSDARPG